MKFMKNNDERKQLDMFEEKYFLLVKIIDQCNNMNINPSYCKIKKL